MLDGIGASVVNVMYLDYDFLFSMRKRFSAMTQCSQSYELNTNLFEGLLLRSVFVLPAPCPRLYASSTESLARTGCNVCTVDRHTYFLCKSSLPFSEELVVMEPILLLLNPLKSLTTVLVSGPKSLSIRSLYSAPVFQRNLD